MTIDGFTVMRIVVEVVAFTESVAVTVSRYVVKDVELPIAPVTDTYPVFVSIEMPVTAGAIDQYLVPVPSEAWN